MVEALLAVLILLPPLLVYLLKSSGSAGFLALCGGFAVVTLSGSDIEHLVGKTRITSLTSNDVDLILLGAPLLLTLLLTYKSVHAKRRRLLQIVPALAAGGLLAVIAAPMFNSALNTDITQVSFWKGLQNVQTYIVGIGLLTSLLLLWFPGPAHSKKHK